MRKMSLNTNAQFISIIWWHIFRCNKKNCTYRYVHSKRRMSKIRARTTRNLNSHTCLFLGTLMMGALIDKKTAIGLIIGTGSNACYMEKSDRVKHWDSIKYKEREVRIFLCAWHSLIVSSNNNYLINKKVDGKIEAKNQSMKRLKKY